MQHRYQPMVPQHIADEAEIAAMHAKLAQKVKTPKPSTPQDVQSPQEKSELKWNKPISKLDDSVITQCGIYCCARVTVQGVRMYELWKRPVGGGMAKQLAARLDNFLQVQKLTQIDADKGVP